MNLLIKIKIIAISIALLLFVLVSLWGCSKVESRSSRELYLNIGTEPPSLDPRTASDLTSFNLLRLLFEGLFRKNLQGINEPALAKSYEVSKEGLTYTFYLREAYWSDGSPVTSHDFANAWRFSLSPHSSAKSFRSMKMIKNALAVKKGEMEMSALGIETPNDETLVVHLEQPTPYFIELLLLPSFFPVPSQVIQRHPKWAEKAESYVSNGPFIMQSWQPYHQIVLKQNPRYWDKEAIKIETINMAMIENAATELNMFEQGEIDWVGYPISSSISFDAIPSLKQEGILYSEPWASNYFYLFNTEASPFHNVNMRKAFSYAINREEIVQHITQGGERPALNFVPPGLGLPSKNYFQDGDIQTAKTFFKQGLEELGIALEHFPPIRLIYNSNDNHHKIAQAIQQQWKNAFGIEVLLENMEWKVYLEQLNSREFQVARLGLIPAYLDPLSYLELVETKEDPMNLTGWSDPHFERLIHQSHHQTGLERAQSLMEAEKILMEAMPIAPIYFLNLLYLKNPKLKGVYFSPIGLVELKWAYFEDF